MNKELEGVSIWLHANKLILNVQKNIYQVYNQLGNDINLNIMIHGEKIEVTEKVKYLGITIDPALKWKYIDDIAIIISRNIGILSRAKYFLPEKIITLALQLTDSS